MVDTSLSYKLALKKDHTDTESKLYACACFIDFKQAFDRVWHADVFFT